MKIAKRSLTALALLSVLSSGAQARSGSWVRFHDTNNGLALSHPAGWTVSTSGMQVVVTSPDRNSVVLISAIKHAPDEDPRTRLNNFPQEMGSVFSQAHIENIEPHDQKAIATFSYQTPDGGAGRGRLLCVWGPRKAVYYAIGAPASRASAEAKILVRVLHTLAIDKPGVVKHHRASPARPLAYTRWTDPREKAFTVDVPRGWKVQGGEYRILRTDVRTLVAASSPDNDMSVMLGDPRIPGVIESPSRLNMMAGGREGSAYNPNGYFQILVLRYMPAQQFNEWYIHRYISQSLDNIQITHQGGGASGQGVTFGNTEFTGRNRERGKTYSYVLHTEVTRYPSPGAQMPNVGQDWAVSKLVLIGIANESQAATSQAVASRMLSTLKGTPQWLARENHTTTAMTQAFRTEFSKAPRLAHVQRYNSDAIMGRYWSHVAAQDKSQANFCDYIGDRQSVRDTSTGETGKISSGYSNNYRGRDGTILQTNSAYPPGTDWTPLQNL
jgi:hypothetical protein